MTVIFRTPNPGICKECHPLYWNGMPTNNDRYCDNSCLGCDDGDTFPVCDVQTRTVHANVCYARCAGVDENDVINGTCEAKFEKELKAECPECGSQECKFIGTHRYCHCKICDNREDPVCGTDGRTYESVCVLERTNCEYPELNVRFDYNGKCNAIVVDVSDNCDFCNFGGSCVNGMCNCDFFCDATLHHPVCGSDNVTYRQCFQTVIN